MSARTSPLRFAVPAGAAALVLLVAAELGLLPPLHRAWATNLWQYLPLALSIALAVLTLALCWPSARSALVRRLTDVRALPELPRSAGGVAAFVVAAAVVLWLLRERRMYGDSSILLYNAAAGAAFLFPDIGATFLFRLCHLLGTALGTSGQTVVQVAVALAGGATLYLFARLAEVVAPTRPRALLFLLLVLGGGLLRVLAGHVEVYAFVLLCAGAYFWGAVAYLRGRTTATWPALAFGVGLWMHLSFSFLAPSLLALLLMSPGGHDPRPLVQRVLRAALVGAAPVVGFLLLMLVTGHLAELHQCWETLARWTGLEPSPVGHEAFLRGPFSESGAGTRYAILSAGHVKYLANAFFLLIPAALPVLLVQIVASPRRLFASPEARFFAAAGGFMMLYALIVRPVWGPYDWDLFSLTAASLACLAATVLVREAPEPPLTEVAVLLVGGGLLLVTIPFLVIGIAPAEVAGPFALGLDSAPGESPVDAFERNLGPWL